VAQWRELTKNVIPRVTAADVLAHSGGGRYEEVRWDERVAEWQIGRVYVIGDCRGLLSRPSDFVPVGSHSMRLPPDPVNPGSEINGRPLQLCTREVADAAPLAAVELEEYFPREFGRMVTLHLRVLPTMEMVVLRFVVDDHGDNVGPRNVKSKLGAGEVCWKVEEMSLVYAERGVEMEVMDDNGGMWTLPYPRDGSADHVMFYYERALRESGDGSIRVQVGRFNEFRMILDVA
jgi:hypothetical protein